MGKKFDWRLRDVDEVVVRREGVSVHFRREKEDNAGNVASYLKYALSRARSFSLMAVASGLPISL